MAIEAGTSFLKHESLNYSMFFRITIILLFSATSLYAESYPWYKGSVVLSNEKVIAGEIAFSPEDNVVLLKKGTDDEAMMVIPAFRVVSFSFYDEEISTERRFITFLNREGPARVYEFYEVLEEGIIGVLRKQQNLWYSFRTQTVDFDYFVLIEEKIIPMKTFRWRIYPSIKKSSSEIRDFVKRNRINIFNMPDVIRFCNYYNAAQPAMASNNPSGFRQN
jgi:hypothetical protein